MPIPSSMGSHAFDAPPREPIDLQHLAFACEAAVAAAARAGNPAQAIDGALGALHDELGGVAVAAFVLEHGRLWSVGVRGYARIPNGLPLDEGVMGRAARTSVPQLERGEEEGSSEGESGRHGGSELAVPLVLPTGVVGVIKIETTAWLPDGSCAAVEPLVSALVHPMEDLRASRTVDLSSLARLFVHMSSLRDPDTISGVAVESLGRVLPVETSQLLLLDEEGRLVESNSWSASGHSPNLLPSEALQALHGRLDASAVFELIDLSVTKVTELAGLDVRSVVLVPLRANGAELGLLVGSSRFVGKFERDHGELASLLAAHTAASLDAAIALERERRSAHTDALTGLLNRRGLEDRLDTELQAAQEGRQPLSLVTIDLDDFKEVNDRAGHEFGDALLREVGLVFRDTCPEGAVAARPGGDEFVVLLPGSDVDEAVLLADKVRQELISGLDEAGFPLRLSLGVSTYPYDGTGVTQLLRASDQALYRAKARGKNCVVPFREITRAMSTTELVPAITDRTADSGGAVINGLGDTLDAASAIWAEESVESVLERLGKSLTFVVGATATLISRIEGERLADSTRHSLRDVDLGENSTYELEDYPVTRNVLETGVIVSISFLDEDIDSAEAFVLRELEMNAAMLVPLVIDDRPWGLVEIYDMRLRRYSSDEEALARFLVGQASRRIEHLASTSPAKRRLLRPRGLSATT